MTQQQILEKAVQKAQNNGWLDEWDINHTDSMGWTMVGKGKVKKSKVGLTAKITYMLSENDILFDKEFAKALWGEAVTRPVTFGVEILRRGWREHLREMVLADDPIEYLGKHLDGFPA